MYEREASKKLRLHFVLKCLCYSAIVNLSTWSFELTTCNYYMVSVRITVWFRVTYMQLCITNCNYISKYM